MFERYTEKARRAIFFARYEASQSGSDFIRAEHLLLGILREDVNLPRKLGPEGVQAIRDYISQHSLPFEKGVSVSVDLPLDLACKHVLAQAAQEADALGHRVIASGHLVLGLLRTDQGIATEALRSCGIEYVSFRNLVAQLAFPTSMPPVQDPLPGPEIETSESRTLERCVPALREACSSLANLVDKASPELDTYSEADGFRTLGGRQWIRKVALGHLIDWACTHQQWFARALTEPRLAANGYPNAEWVTAQKYRDVDWSELTDVWVNLNRLLVHGIAQVPEAKLATPCKIGLQEAIPFQRLIENYVQHCQDEMAEILTRG